MGGIKLKLQDGWSTNDPYTSLYIKDSPRYCLINQIVEIDFYVLQKDFQLFGLRQQQKKCKYIFKGIREKIDIYDITFPLRNFFSILDRGSKFRETTFIQKFLKSG